MYDVKYHIFINQISISCIIFAQLIDVPYSWDHATVDLW
jgi:hypothetical protein